MNWLKKFSVSGSLFDVISELYTYTVGGYFVSGIFWGFLQHTQTPAGCSFVSSILFYRLKIKKSTKKICIQDCFFFSRFTHCRYFAFQPPSQPAWRERDVSLSLFSFYLFIPPGGYLSRKEGDGRI